MIFLGLVSIFVIVGVIFFKFVNTIEDVKTAITPSQELSSPKKFDELGHHIASTNTSNSNPHFELVDTSTLPKSNLSDQQIKSKTTAAWFALCLGGFGVDLFYLNRKSLGLIALSILGTCLALYFVGHALTEQAWNKLRFGQAWINDMVGNHGGIEKLLANDPQWQTGIQMQWFAQFCPTASAIWSLIRSVTLFAMDQSRFDEIYNGGKSQLKNQTSSSQSADEILKLHKLKQDGILSEEEFFKAKQKLVG